MCSYGCEDQIWERVPGDVDLEVCGGALAQQNESSMLVDNPGKLGATLS